MDLQVNPKFRDLLPTLSEEETTHLLASLQNDGCRDPILIWRNQIVDGHNRHALCLANDIGFRVQEMPFGDEDEAIEWMIVNQLGRRNLSGPQRTLHIAQLYELRKKRVGAPDGSKNAAKINVISDITLISDESDQHVQKSNGISDIPLLEDSRGVPNTSKNVAKIKGVTVTPLISDGEVSRSRLSKNVETEPTELTYEIDPQFIKKDKTAAKIAKEMHVAPRTVTRAVAVGRAIETLPAEVKTDFMAGKISQKAVIEKAKEVTAPKPETPTAPLTDGQDDFTRLAKKHATAIARIFHEYKDVVEQAARDFRAAGQRFDTYGDRLRFFSRNRADSLLQLETEVSMLKTLRLCPKCEGKKCDRCKESGYLYKTYRDDLLREMKLK